MSILSLLQQLQDSAFAQAFVESQYAYPIVESAHVLGLALSVGLLAIVDLHMIGAAFRGRPLSETLGVLRPWLLAGFAVVMISGGLLFVSEAAKLYLNTLFQLKILFILVAGANAALFELRLGRGAGRPSGALAIPFAARVAGWVSLLSWALVILFGRWIAYGFGSPS